MNITSQWIDASERLPEKTDYYIVLFKEYDPFENDYNSFECRILYYHTERKMWNIKSPIKVLYWHKLF